MVDIGFDRMCGCVCVCGGGAESLHTVSVCVLRRLESSCMLELHGNANGEGRRVLGGNAGKVKAPAEEREEGGGKIACQRL